MMTSTGWSTRVARGASLEARLAAGGSIEQLRSTLLAPSQHERSHGEPCGHFEKKLALGLVKVVARKEMVRGLLHTKKKQQARLLLEEALEEERALLKQQVNGGVAP